jgi:hypothetical protein
MTRAAAITPNMSSRPDKYPRLVVDGRVSGLDDMDAYERRQRHGGADSSPVHEPTPPAVGQHSR